MCVTYGFRKVSSYTKIYYCRYIGSRVRSGQTKAAVAKRTHRGGVTDVIPNINGLVISTSVHPRIHRMKKRKKKFNPQNNFVFYRPSTGLFEGMGEKVRIVAYNAFNS